MRVAYNERDPFAAEWLRRLCAQGSIEPGEVHEDDVRELNPEKVRGADQFHAFAGIGVWSYALRLAGWPAAVPVWTGSCPCQPFSQAGRGRGTQDDRHLWPAWRRLVDECRPPVILGEQVASPLGRSWLGSVQADLEALGYLFAATDLCAAGVGAPHQRQRLFFAGVRLEDSDRQRRERLSLQLQPRRSQQAVLEASGRGQARGLAGPDREGRVHGPEPIGRRLADPPGGGYTRGAWAPADWLLCRDGKARPVEPGTFPLAHGAAGRVALRLPGGETKEINRRGALRGLGNAIVPQVAAAFIQAVMEII